MKKITIILSSFCLLITIILVSIYLYQIRVQYPVKPANARSIDYYDLNSNFFYGKGVNVVYTSGHRSNNMSIYFSNFRPYQRLEMYEIDDVLYIIYDEDKTQEKRNIVIGSLGFAGSTSSSKGYEFHVIVYKNGRPIKNVYTWLAEE